MYLVEDGDLRGNTRMEKGGTGGCYGRVPERIPG